jgi:hypothetical protein
MENTPPRTASRKKRALQAASRAALLWAVAAIILTQAAIRVVIDNAWPELRDPTFEIKARRLSNLIGEHKERPLVVLMTGSSVTSNAFKAKQLEENLGTELNRDVVVFNMGCHGGGALTQCVWLRRLVERGVRPDLLCVECSPQLYERQQGPGQPDIPSDASRFPAHVLTWTDLQTLRPLVPASETRREWRRYRWLPAYFHRLTILNYTANPLVPMRDRIPTWNGTIDDRCWTDLPPREPEVLTQNIRQIAATYGPRLREFQPSTATLRALENLLTFAQDERIPTVLVLAPQSPTFRELYSSAEKRSLLQKISVLSERRNSAVVDASEWLREEDFTDCIHPNSIGAEVFSTRLRAEVILPILAKHQR